MNAQQSGASIPPWYTDQEIDNLCEGLITDGAKVRHLKRLGLTVSRKPNGRPVVMRAHAERVLSGLKDIETAQPSQTPRTNADALILRFGARTARV